MQNGDVVRISARRANWDEVRSYLYGQVAVTWDQAKNEPRIFTDGESPEYEVFIERHWMDAGQRDRLRSGLIGSRVIGTVNIEEAEVTS